ncbi:small multidrug resistance protein [Oscillochloris trichoides DG-6]|uniref:Small multidrug resistance protein n=1 Tax=Oscillochloris trichoides DG-6 TaxID=765420 RepID=E1IFT3_9CHLR|nr:multidrug efflux SMR transporter [Oscillochloris trichoides]EFO79974.1 small multidrug resistance protein [Oscillochloris trichoides DG-6]
MPLPALLLLLGAITSEVIGTTALKYSDGFSKFVPSLLVIVGYGLAFYLLSLSLRQIPLGSAYAIWSGLGTAATAAIGVWLWQESVSPLRIMGIVLIIAGVVVLNLAQGGKG